MKRILSAEKKEMLSSLIKGLLTVTIHRERCAVSISADILFHCYALIMSQKFESSSATLQAVRERVGHVVVGQENLVERLLLALLCNGHVLLEGVP